MSDSADTILTEILDVQRRILTAQETSVANQREAIERQRAVIRVAKPLLALFVLGTFGPYLWYLVAWLVNR